MNHATLATHAPSANHHRPVGPWWAASDPSSSTVSRYTCGLRNVSAVARTAAPRRVSARSFEASRASACRARSSDDTPYQVRNATPSHRTTSSAAGARSTILPMPATPATIRTTSATAQIATTMPTCWRARPCRSTNAFCAPIATISDRPVTSPVSVAASIAPN